MKLSVLMSVYYKEKPQYLDACLCSLYEQTAPAEEIICVKDGPLNNDLDSILSKWEKKLPLKIIGYEKNKGLAYALNFGLKYCSCDYIARMDTDDIAIPERFEKQLYFINANPNIAVFSSYVKEFIISPSEISFLKKVPVEYQDIIKYSLKRNPFNHMSVCFKKQVIIDLGSYQEVPFFEDYDLWMRVINNNYKVANIPEVLVYARIGNDMIGRRHGLSYAKKELYFFKRQLEAGFLSIYQYIYLCLVRIPVRLLPKNLLGIIYRLLRVKR